MKNYLFVSRGIYIQYKCNLASLHLQISHCYKVELSKLDREEITVNGWPGTLAGQLGANNKKTRNGTVFKLDRAQRCHRLGSEI